MIVGITALKDCLGPKVLKGLIIISGTPNDLLIEIQTEEIKNRFINETLDQKQIEECSIKLGTLEKELETKSLRWFELSEN